MDNDWTGINPASLTGFSGGQPDSGSGGLVTGVAAAAATRADTNAPLYSPQNPLFWVAGFMLAAAGLVYASAHIKAGPFKASASA